MDTSNHSARGGTSRPSSNGQSASRPTMTSRSASMKGFSFSDDGSLGSSSQGTRKSFWQRRAANNGRDGIPLNVAVKEDRRVGVSKSVMIFILMIVAAGFCAATFLLLKQEEEDDFARQFENYASEIIAVSSEHVESTFVTIEAFARSVTSNAIDAGEHWPNVTLPHFGARAESVAALAAGADIVTTAIVVEADQRESFEEFARENVHEMLQQTLDYQNIEMNSTDLNVPDMISYLNITSKETLQEPEGGDGPYVVNWQRYPYVTTKVRTMNNLLRVPTIRSAVVAANATLGPKLAFFSGVRGVSSQVIQPIFEQIYAPHEDDSGRKMVGVVWLILDWGTYFGNLLPEGVNGTTLVLKSSCGFESTYIINGLVAEFQGLEDLHDTNYDHMEIVADFFSFGEQTDDVAEDVCIDQLTLHLYPSEVLEEANTSNKPAVYTAVVAAIFVFVSLTFLIYDWMVQSRQRKVMDRVITQDKIVSNLFPATIRDRLYGIGDGNGDATGSTEDSSLGGSVSRLKLDMGDLVSPEIYGAKPLADLFLETTVLFADISGFTAWSSAREPAQVFQLLENIYGAFDRLAARHNVFKVETIGDCYVAVTGLPDPNKEHAVLMAKFARECIEKMNLITAKLEIGLGPDTGDLRLRIGLNSGQVTAGVLRGERSRFQLFGDTVNVAARMESSGEASKIQISSVTADLLREQGRSKWVKLRGDIMIPGKGTLQTYWLETKEESEDRMNAIRVAQAAAGLSDKVDRQATVDTEHSERSEIWSEEDENDELLKGQMMTKKQRLVEWNVEILSDLLKRILAARNKKSKALLKAEQNLTTGQTVLEEFEEIITLPKVTMNDLKHRKDPDFIMLDDQVIGQLRGLLSEVADLYRENAFHSFEHASHVTASVAKLLSRIVTSDTTNQTSGPKDLEATDLAGHSYGITSDPLTQFAVVFSAIIHDADHPGVPNAQLVKENDPWAAKYKGKSLAEQNSVDLVWNILMKPDYVDLRACIYADETELKRFRQLIVNVVMATDIADKELGALRKARWNKAFDPMILIEEGDQDMAINRKATIVLEHLIQASDVSHTMQHWQVYKKWNEKFFMECYGAWKEGRAGEDPSKGWYNGEIGFFDFYIIPLAKKLDSCGVFGVSSHEYLNYATANRDEWKRKGQDIVRGYIEAYEADHSGR